MNIPNDPEHQNLRHMLKDFATLIHLVGRISTLFIGDEFLARAQEGHELFKQLIMVASYSSKNKLYLLQVSGDVAGQFVDV